MRKTMIALMVGLAVLVVMGPRVSTAGSVNASFGFFFGPYGVAAPAVVYEPYYPPPRVVVYDPPPPAVVYRPYVTGFQIYSHPRHHHRHDWHHHGHH